jgi:hypothetical protein
MALDDRGRTMDNFSLVPVDHQPDFENVSLVPVDHDPIRSVRMAWHSNCRFNQHPANRRVQCSSQQLEWPNPMPRHN